MNKRIIICMIIIFIFCISIINAKSRKDTIKEIMSNNPSIGISVQYNPNYEGLKDEIDPFFLNKMKEILKNPEILELINYSDLPKKKMATATGGEVTVINMTEFDKDILFILNIGEDEGYFFLGIQLLYDNNGKTGFLIGNIVGGQDLGNGEYSKEALFKKLEKGLYRIKKQYFK